MEAGATLPVLNPGLESLCWAVLRGGPRAPWPSPSSDGRPLVVLEVEAGRAQLEVVEVDTEVGLIAPPLLMIKGVSVGWLHFGLTLIAKTAQPNWFSIKGLITAFLNT